MKVTQEALELIKEGEGLRLKAYLCPAKVWTIGYGATFYEDKSSVRPGDTITKDRAEALFSWHVNRFAGKVKDMLTREVTDNQFSAMVSLAYNIGTEAFRKSSVLRHTNAGDFQQAADAFGLWRMAGGKVLPGLVKRREKEKQLFLS